MYYSCCDLIGRLPLVFCGDSDACKDHAHLDVMLDGYLLLQKAGLLCPALEDLVCVCVCTVCMCVCECVCVCVCVCVCECVCVCVCMYNVCVPVCVCVCV